MLELLVGARRWSCSSFSASCSSSRAAKRKTAEFDDNLGRLADQGEDRLAQPMDSLSDTGRMRAPAA